MLELNLPKEAKVLEGLTIREEETMLRRLGKLLHPILGLTSLSPKGGTLSQPVRNTITSGVQLLYLVTCTKTMKQHVMMYYESVCTNTSTNMQ